MKHLLLAVSLFGVLGNALAQPCTPNPLYQDSLFGVWPDTTTNFGPGVVGQPYSQTMDLIVPRDGGDIDPMYAGVMIDSVVFNGVTGLPPGLVVACNSQTPAPCTYITGRLGCGVIQGTPTQTGTFPLTLNVTAYSELLPGVVLPIPYDFTGYRIIVTGATGIADLAPAGLGGVRNVPNPFASRTSIEFLLSRASDTRVRVFNLLGEEVWEQRMQGKAGVNRVPFESGTLQDGVYLFKVETGRETFTGRMVLHR